LRRLLGIIAHHSKRAARAALRVPDGSAYAVANALARLMAGAGHPIEARGRSNEKPRFGSCDQLVRAHFETWSETTHLNMSSLRDTLSLLEERPSLILETDSSAWGTNSSRLFDSYVASFGGEFHTVDIRIEPMLKLRGL
jgi:hypothetical protein